MIRSSVVIPSAARNLLFLFFFLVLPASAQVQTGTPPFGSFSGGPDIIDNANLNVHWTIPVIHKPGRGTNFSYDLSYDSSVWYPVGASGSQTWQPVTNWGWRGVTEVLTGYISYDSVTTPWCLHIGQYYGQQTTYSNYVYHDQLGVTHPFSGSNYTQRGAPAYCNPTTTTINAVAADGSGATLTSRSGTGTITYPNGQIVSAPFNTNNGAASMTDRNGNQISADNNGGFTDTLGATALTVTGTAPSNTTFTYTAASGSAATYTVKYTTYSVQTNFGCSGITDYGTNGTTTAPLVSEIDLPDNTKYTFNYEATPSKSGFVTGRISSVKLPTGGTITYNYIGGNQGITCTDGSTSGLKRFTPDTGTNFWEYDRTAGTGAAYTTTITDPAGNQTKIQFQGIYETERQIYQGPTSGTLLSTIDTCYNASTPPCTSTGIGLPISGLTVQTTISSAGGATLVSKKVTSYLATGVPFDISQYGFGSGSAPTNPTTETAITYASLGSIISFPQQVSVKDGSGTLLAQTTYNYDETTPVNAPANTPHLFSVSGSRGNLTSVQRCTNLASCSSSFVKTSMTYDTAGQLQSAKDPLNNQTTFSYTDNYLDDDGSNPPSHTHSTSAPTDAFATTVTPPMNGALTFKYYYSGQLALSTDQNGNNSFSHFDSLGRLTSSYGPTLGTLRPWLLNVYAASDTQVDSYTDINDTSATATSSCTVCRHDQIVTDGLGRALTQQLANDPEGGTSVDSTFDVRGQVKTVSHAHRSTSSMTDGIETPTYDAEGRTTKVLHPDGTSALTYYGPTITAAGGLTSQNCASSTYGYGFPTLFVDESGRKRQIWTDGLGRTIEGDEPNSSGSLNATSPSVCYSYDPLGNLLRVTNTSNSQTRTYTYDPLSRFTSVTTPEAGASSYYYTTAGGALCSGNPSAACRRADARGITTTYTFDALNRPTGKTYSDSTPSVSFFYDQTSYNGLTITNGKGRLTGMSDSSGTTAWSHDAAGRIITEKRTILGVTETISYAYNLDGSVATITYPSTKTVTYTVSNAQRLLTAKDTASGTQFALAASYAPIGALQSTITGQISGGFGGVTESHTFNNRLEYTSTKALPPSGPAAMDLSLAHALSTGDNGSVTAITNNVSTETGRTLSLAYDPLNRISSATTQATSGVDCWGQNFVPDALANLNSITSAQCSSNTLGVSVDGNNHITGTSFAYDATGNMTGDGQTGITYTFDAESRLQKVTGVTGGPWCYVYDGNGLRVAKKSGANSDCTGGTVTKLYWRSLSSDSLAETDGTGSTTNAAYNEYVSFAGRRIASRTGTGAIFYFFADQLGSTRTITTGNGPSQTSGQLCYDQDYTPYGQEVFTTAQMSRLQTTACPTNYKFTGYERDSETGLDYAFNRYYSSRLGRFMSTDPLSGSLGNLQSHNAYAYAHNNPLNFTDPLGLYLVCDGAIGYDYVDYFTMGDYQGTDVVYLGNYSGCVLQTSQPWLTTPSNNLPPVKGDMIHVECPGKWASRARWAAMMTLPPLMNAQLQAKTSGKVATVGYDANLGGTWGTFGLDAHAGDALAFDPKGNVAWLSTTGFGGGFGADTGFTAQAGIMRATSVFQLESAISQTFMVQFGQGLAGSIATDLEGNVTYGIGVGEGVITASTTDQTTVTVVACSQP